jgi:hypothetical protein
MQRFQSNWHLMKELTVLSLNIIFIKDMLQALDRINGKLQYMNFPQGSIVVTKDNLRLRKRELHKRIAVILEDLLNSKKEVSKFVFIIDRTTACFTKKDIDNQFAIFSNIFNTDFALDLRSGALYPINFESDNLNSPIMQTFAYRKQHEQSLLKWFEIDPSEPLKNNLRY